ncbi:peptide chain release factor N(5)-glutamine methyltransferase [Leptolyngbya sp. FACHB-261]|uniref:peptide chain release factor N(5)-glutamine methyltransferase n=1 Tax=Leptolyngbya sp. FACHB-261 TaxID=2692806 RepID=UPI0016843707|nr:peptide chain release factor N(5)-glutamine methyltransferase [Leptolyngbya sp. FACHB-261]MBD2100219.1 peptide chain release factor N(5)-glutamine methyltransferase [Leptolyngbya sp. FACHB-261]
MSSQAQPQTQDFWQWYDQAQQQARALGIPTAELDWLLRELAGLDRLSLRLRPSLQHLSSSEFDHLWQRRLQERIPVQYLVGRVSWRDFELRVTPAVLIPRPETELLVDLAAARAHSGETWADLGTGSGAIALGLARLQLGLKLVATDISEVALAIAQENAKRLGSTVEQQVQFYQGNWFEPLSRLNKPLDGMMSNPPYIPAAEVLQLEPEVRQHEPHLALDGGPDGLSAFRQLVQEAPSYLRPGGHWLVEVMADQAASVAQQLAASRCYTDIQTYPDLAGIERFVGAVCCHSRWEAH